VAASICPACGAIAFVTGPRGDGGSCSSCGYSSGESNRCPHCGAIARIEGTGLASVCAVCGGPRVPANFGGERAANALREQKKALAQTRLASVATVIQAVFAASATLVGLAVAPASIVGKAIVFAVALVPFLLAMRSRRHATKARENAAKAGERAWQAAAEDVATQAKEGVTVATLAKRLGIEPDRADKLLTALTVDERTRIDVGEDAEVRYSAAPLTPATGPRVDAFEELRAEDELADGGRASKREGRVR
jgi:hypothetical protein